MSNIKINQNDLEHIQDLVQRGCMTADQANVEIVRMARARVVTGSMPESVRKSLNAAVKDGSLKHKCKSGHKPEIYYHPSFEHLANAERSRIERDTINAIANVCC